MVGNKSRLGALSLVALLVGGTATAQQRAVTLEEAVRRAEIVQPRIVQAIGVTRTAEARIRATKGAWLPDLTFSTSGTSSFSEGVDRVDPSSGQIISGNTTTTSYNGSVGSSLTLFDGFRRSADGRAARAASEAAEASLVDARFQQALTTTSTFLDALAARQLVAVREASVRRAEEQLNASIARLRTGAATRSDTLRSAVTLGNARLQLLNTRTQLATAEANLARLIGEPGRVAAQDDPGFYRAIVIDTGSFRVEALARSPQVLSAEASARAAQSNLSVSRSSYWPTVSLSGSFSYNGNARNDYQFFTGRSASLRVNWPIFNGWSREQAIATQLVNLDNAEANAAEAKRLIQANLTTRLAELDAATLRIEITQTSVVAATEDLRVQQERYRLGAATIVDVLTSQEALNQAEVDVVNARFDYLRAKAQLEALLGRPL